jgi:hypothetical protein
MARRGSGSQCADNENDKRSDAEFGNDIAHSFAKSVGLLRILFIHESKLWLEAQKIARAKTNHDGKQKQFHHKQASVCGRDEGWQAANQKITVRQAGCRERAHNEQAHSGKPSGDRTRSGQ